MFPIAVIDVKHAALAEYNEQDPAHGQTTVSVSILDWAREKLWYPDSCHYTMGNLREMLALEPTHGIKPHPCPFLDPQQGKNITDQSQQMNSDALL